MWRAGVLTAMLVAASLAFPQMAGAASNPPGNNGTVKIHDMLLDNSSSNKPHPEACPFTVAFFGFDKGDVAKVTFEAWPPTPKGESEVLLTDTVNIGADDNSGGGSPAGFDGDKAYELDFGDIEPQPQQGFHVKLTVEVTSPDSTTPKFNKYKVFWAQPCQESAGTTSTTSTTLGGGGGGGGAKGATTTLRGQGALPFTGSSTVPLAVTGLLLLLVGAGGVVASRRLRTTR
jgi:hypothetical protein